MVAVGRMRNILMELRKVCQHPYLSAPELENEDAPEEEQQRQLINGSGKLSFLKLLLPKLKERGHRVLLFSQFKIALDRIEDFLHGEGYKYLRLDGDLQQAKRQKAMDAYNAPDSDYFIFLLTTRAGGVGINLASADTVIIYDPDFNPHMDLQAIARSHRYGQKKKVLVFKLMTKNSVEEQIILNGKKKMVLDHLVVQQMGKENEEGDIDDLLLRGAAALYEANEEGVAASDIRYTSKDVDELIDKVEADADAEAKATEEREQERERAKVRGTATAGDGASGEIEGEQAKPKESMSFGFAKIWEADRNRLEELAEDEERPDDVNTWQLVIDNARKVREAEKAAILENGRQKRAAAAVKYGPDGAISDDTPKKERRKYTKKGKARAGTSSEDADFVGGMDSSDSDSDSLAADEEDQLANLLDSEGKPVINGMAAGERYTKKQLLRLARLQAKAAATTAALAAAAAAGDTPSAPNGENVRLQSGGSNGDLGPVAGPSSQQSTQSSKRHGETAEERLARKERRKAEKSAERSHRYQAMVEAELVRELNGGNVPSVPGPSRSLPARAPSAIDPHIIRNGQQICQYLYHVLREFKMNNGLHGWAIMALPELPAKEREEIYHQLSQDVDMELYRQGQSQYFTHPQQIANVLPLLRNAYPVIPLENEEMMVPVLQPEMGVYRNSQSNTVGNATQAYHSPRPPAATIPATAPAVAAVVVAPPHVLPIENGHLPIHANPSALTSAPTSRSATPLLRVSPSRRPAPPNAVDGTNSEKSKCPHCAKEHTLENCRAMMGAPELGALRETITQSTHDTEADKAQTVGRIDDMLRLHAENNTPSYQQLSPRIKALVSSSQDLPAVSSPPGIRVEVQNGYHQPLPENNTYGNGDGHSKDAAIFIGDDDYLDSNGFHDPLHHDDDGDSRPSKRARKNGSHSFRRGFKGCPICGSAQNHAAVVCPVVQRGPDSIKDAMRQFNTSDPMWYVLRQLFDESAEPTANVSSPTHLCALCRTVCGRTIRQCAEMHGGRKVLKDEIKRLEAARQGGDLDEDQFAIVKDNVAELYDTYLKWPRSQG